MATCCCADTVPDAPQGGDICCTGATIGDSPVGHATGGNCVGTTIEEACQFSLDSYFAIYAPSGVSYGDCDAACALGGLVSCGSPNKYYCADLGLIGGPPGDPCENAHEWLSGCCCENP